MRNPRLNPRSLTPAAAFATLILLASNAPASAQQQEAMTTFDLRSQPEFRDYKRVIERYIAQRSHSTINHACIVGLVVDKSKLAWLIWDDGSKLVLWESGESDLDTSRQQLDTIRDVVERNDDLRGSTFLVTKQWLDRLNTTCKAKGINLALKTSVH
jgi:hypothetical protein